MTKSASIAAVIPTYNCARYLPEAVASIRRQTVPVEQIIIVDDGSTDDTDEVVQSLGTDILYLKQRNAGPSAARNAGTEAARAEWIAFLDADDMWVPAKTEQQLAALERHPDLVLVASDMAEIDPEGRMVVASMLQRHHLLEFFGELDSRPVPGALARLVGKNFIPTGAVLVRRAVVSNLGGFRADIRFGEDWELWCRIAARHPVACMPTVHLLRRRHEANAVSKPAEMLRGLVQAARSLREDCSGALLGESCDPAALVAERLTDLGYFHFDRAEYREAREALKSSLGEKPTARALLYFIASHIPAWVIRQGRLLKQNLLPIGHHDVSR